MAVFQSRWLVLCALAAAMFTTTGFAERPRVYCIDGATVIPEPGRQISAGTVVLRDGLIEAVGANIDPPADAVIIDGDGLWVYPGLIDPSVDLDTGSGEAAPQTGQSASRSSGGQAKTPPGPVHPLSLVHPERRASDTLLPFDGEGQRQAERLRALGFTTVLAAPERGDPRQVVTETFIGLAIIAVLHGISSYAQKMVTAIKDRTSCEKMYASVSESVTNWAAT